MNIEIYNNYVQELIDKAKLISYPQVYDGSNYLYFLPIYEKLTNNCYCYSLGFKVNSMARKLFRPGWISNYAFYKSSPKEKGCFLPKYETKQQFIEAVLKDIEILKISYDVITTKLNSSEVNDLSLQCIDEQSSIIIVGTGDLEKGEFHFVRSDLGGFSHKLGWHYPPEQIENIEGAFNQINCEPCLILRLKNHK